MANSYTKAAFEITVTSAEADLLGEIAELSETLAWNDVETGARLALYESQSPAFRELFPRGIENPFEDFLTLFDDPSFPSLDFEVDIDDPDDPDDTGTRRVVFTGEQFSPEVAAAVIQRVCRSALPCAFDYSFDCDKLRPDEFGGGYCVVTADDVIYGTTDRMMDRALASQDDEGADGFVLSVQHPEQGLSFWNEDSGFGRLFGATVFSEKDAAKFDVPIAASEPAWLALPAPLRW